jgi:hypothetical protein
MILAVKVLGLLAIGIGLVIYGTIVKNKWGINTDTVFCVRCKTPLPQSRKPQNLQEALWGGWSCPVCGVHLDKWGREVPLQTRRRSQNIHSSTAQVQGTLRSKPLIFTALGFFCLTVLLSWLGLGGFSSPSTVLEWVITIVVAAVETAIFISLFYFGSVALLNRFTDRLRESTKDPRTKTGDSENGLA